MVLVLNMSDMAQRQGIAIDRALLARELGMPVLATVGVRTDGAQELLHWLDQARPDGGTTTAADRCAGPALNALEQDQPQRVQRLHQEVRRIMGLACASRRSAWSRMTASTPWCCTRCGARCCWR